MAGRASSSPPRASPPDGRRQDRNRHQHDPRRNDRQGHRDRCRPEGEAGRTTELRAEAGRGRTRRHRCRHRLSGRGGHARRRHRRARLCAAAGCDVRRRPAEYRRGGHSQAGRRRPPEAERSPVGRRHRLVPDAAGRPGRADRRRCARRMPPQHRHDLCRCPDRVRPRPRRARPRRPAVDAGWYAGAVRRQADAGRGDADRTGRRQGEHRFPGAHARHRRLSHHAWHPPDRRVRNRLGQGFRGAHRAGRVRPRLRGAVRSCRAR